VTSPILSLWIAGFTCLAFRHITFATVCTHYCSV
jgi:hypothetical protein